MEDITTELKQYKNRKYL